MNSADKRIEELLNRAGQTISDLPKDYQDAAECMRAYAEVQKWRSENNLSTQYECEKYILHLTDVIDRMETALENVCGERDYLLKEYLGCESCTVGEGARFDEEPCLSCENGSEFEWSIPEDWSVNDENR